MYDIIIDRDFLEQDHVMVIKRGKELLFKQLPGNDDRRSKVAEINYLDVVTNGEIHIGEMGEVEKQQCVNLINEYSDYISTTIQDLGKTNATSLKIRCVSDEPVVYRSYRVAEPEKQVLRQIIQELLDNKIIRESDSLYASPVILIKKKSGEHRMCIDFRKLNAITVKDKYPMPLINDQIDKLGGNRYFTGLDLASEYYQVPVDDESTEKTAFVAPEGHYEFLRMPFGLTNGPAVFQRLMDRVLGSLKKSVAFPYLDDVIIPSTTIAEGMARLRQVLDAFRANHLTLKLDKCSFFKRTIEYLGQEISEAGIRPGRRKVDAVLNMQAPQSVKQVR